MGKNDEGRFEIVQDEKVAMMHLVRVLRDRETGVCYVHAAWGTAGGLTVLVDAEGRPVVRP